MTDTHIINNDIPTPNKKLRSLVIHWCWTKKRGDEKMWERITQKTYAYDTPVIDIEYLVNPLPWSEKE